MGICVITFSSRKNGNCHQIGELIGSLSSDVKQYHFSDFEIHPCGNCHCECFTKGDLCPWIEDKECELLDAVTNSTLAYFVLPNYCDYPCAHFFIFNERSLCYFQNDQERLDAYERVPKKVIVVSNTNENHFRDALSYHADPAPDILFLPAKKYGKASVNGDLLSSEQAVADLRKFISEN